ncbi:MAG: VTC domain-containing protein [Anaerolineaceae bacterium]|nr:VTC domain-containing protein [Anaerolineaceae bacterium]
MNYTALDTYRYERKLLVEGLSEHQVRTLIKLHPALFVQTYPPRYVNNIYLDTPAMDYYYENINGVPQRRKVRIRWYGDLFGKIRKPILEYKIKDGLVGTKESQNLPDFVLDENFDRDQFQETIAKGSPTIVHYHLRELDAVLLNRYYRWYFATTDGRYRVTVDTDMTFYNIKRAGNAFRQRQQNYLNLIVELKYNAEHDPTAQRVSGLFPFSVTKNSKYVEGIERVYL